MNTRDKASGRYADTRFDRMCVCGHTLGNHTADKLGAIQPCLMDGCTCECFKRAKGAK